MSYQNLPESLDIANAPFLARLTSVQVGTGDQDGLYLYGFVEQVLDPATGLPLDAKPGRSDNLDTAATCYALEMRNRRVPGLTAAPPSTPLPAWTTPLPSPLPYPYVWLRLRTGVNGSPVYEFEAPASPYLLILGAATRSGTAISVSGYVASGSDADFSTAAVTVTGLWNATGYLQGGVYDATITLSGYLAGSFAAKVSVSAGGVLLAAFKGTDGSGKFQQGAILATLPATGYSDAAQQVLTHDASGNLAWLSTGACT